ncbi:MAG: serine O-acetyltransferase EpsC [Candidatus Onthomonas sp.]|nr:serine O-acetyltransferase EpsC [Candidatus Onthomonas sp.]
MELEVSGIVQSLLQGSGELQQESSGHLQPNKKVIIGMIEQLQMVLFPEYFVKKRVSQHAAEYYIGSILDEIYINLVDQITLALLQREEFQDADERRRRAEAISIAGQFLTTLPKIQSYLYMDVDAAFDGDPAAFNKDEIIFSYPGLYAIMVNRLAHELHLLKVPLIPRIMTEHAHGLTGIDIHPGATIGKYFFIDHGTGVVIGETTEIGDWVKIYQGVTLGGLSTRAGQGLRDHKRHPTIEDRVTIYSGASILGGETRIGEGSIIGGNAFITQSVPPHTRVSQRNPDLEFQSDEMAETDQCEYWN